MSIEEVNEIGISTLFRNTIEFSGTEKAVSENRFYGFMWVYGPRFQLYDCFKIDFNSCTIYSISSGVFSTPKDIRIVPLM